MERNSGGGRRKSINITHPFSGWIVFGEMSGGSLIFGKFEPLDLMIGRSSMLIRIFCSADMLVVPPEAI
jgi:hypothetical protein